MNSKQPEALQKRTARPAPLNPPDRSNWRSPWVQLKYYSFNPCIYPAMIREASPAAGPGSLVAVYDRAGNFFGSGLYNPNPKARVPLRVFHHGHTPVDESYFLVLLQRALDWRLETLKLPAQTDAFRVVHSDGDSLSGLVVDKFADVLSIEVHSLGIFQRLPSWLPLLHERLGTKRELVEVDERVARMEGIPRQPKSDAALRKVRIAEHGARYEVDFAHGHKTGFFCDQRENRRRLAAFAKDARLLDLCCYTGGFAINAATAGGAREVTGVDLDETAIAQARRNANLNQARINWVHCDAFAYARQMQQNGERWDAVVLDPPKFVESRDEAHLGRRKYEDLNSLGISLLNPGGLLVSCSCSGLLDAEAFEQILVRAAHRQDRRLQIFDRTGASADHPVMSNCPESRYLKVVWAKVF